MKKNYQQKSGNKMSTLDNQFKNLQDKLQQLLKQYQLLQKENQKLKEELQKSVETTSEHEKNIHKIKEQLDASRMKAGGVWSNEDKNAMQKRIDVYLKEIDKCLTLLNG
ncbi:MAG: hypothetical protein JWN76_1350 [Chitinophagaceae bacterium]|nr:hypothetical protein [Chitinophagaceae bacterium]